MGLLINLVLEHEWSHALVKVNKLCLKSSTSKIIKLDFYTYFIYLCSKAGLILFMMKILN